MRVCIEPGCARLGEGTRCEAHRKAKRRRRKDGRTLSASQRGYGSKWRRFRKTFLREHPICQDEAGCIQPATDVDHIDGLGPLGPLGFDPANCRALCGLHHKQRTARDQPGGWNV